MNADSAKLVSASRYLAKNIRYDHDGWTNQAAEAILALCDYIERLPAATQRVESELKEACIGLLLHAKPTDDYLFSSVPTVWLNAVGNAVRATPQPNRDNDSGQCATHFNLDEFDEVLFDHESAHIARVAGGSDSTGNEPLKIGHPSGSGMFRTHTGSSFTYGGNADWTMDVSARTDLKHFRVTMEVHTNDDQSAHWTLAQDAFFRALNGKAICTNYMVRKPPFPPQQ